MNKKGVLGLDTAKLFVLAILALVIVSVVTLIVLDSISGVQSDAYGGTLTNATTQSVISDSGVYVYPTGLSSANLDCTLSPSVITNTSTGDAVPSTNYTVVECTIACTVGGCELFNNSLWNVSGTYTKTSDSKGMLYNTSDALSDFFNDSGTWFTLIGVVIIILIIAVVIVVINRFSGGGTFSGTPQTANI